MAFSISQTILTILLRFSYDEVFWFSISLRQLTLKCFEFSRQNLYCHLLLFLTNLKIIGRKLRLFVLCLRLRINVFWLVQRVFQLNVSVEPLGWSSSRGKQEFRGPQAGLSPQLSLGKLWIDQRTTKLINALVPLASLMMVVSWLLLFR